MGLDKSASRQGIKHYETHVYQSSKTGSFAYLVQKLECADPQKAKYQTAE
jgi:hypothetical protein